VGVTKNSFLGEINGGTLVERTKETRKETRVGHTYRGVHREEDIRMKEEEEK